MRDLFFVGVLFGVMYLLFDWLLESPPPQVMNTSTGTAVVLSMDRSGHYRGNGTVNGLPVNFLVDSGASYVALPQSIASKAGINLRDAVQITVETAAGKTNAYRIVVDSVRFAEIEQRNVAVVVVPELDEPLLGMNFLKKISISHKDGQMTLRVD